MDHVLQSPVLAVVLVLTLDQAQFGLQALAFHRQAAVVLQQLAVFLEESGRGLLLPLVLLQLRHQLLSKQRGQTLKHLSDMSPYIPSSSQ